MIIKVENLTKTYKSYERGNTFRKPFTVSLSAKQICGSLKRNLLHYGKGRMVAFLAPTVRQINDIEDINRNTLPTVEKLILWVILPGRTEKICGPYWCRVWPKITASVGHTTH